MDITLTPKQIAILRQYVNTPGGFLPGPPEDRALIDGGYLSETDRPDPSRSPNGIEPTSVSGCEITEKGSRALLWAGSAVGD